MGVNTDKSSQIHRIPPTYYGDCSECNRQRTAPMWCKRCDVLSLKRDFVNWTSGNNDIDNFIRYTQYNAKQVMDYLEWIEFDQLELVTNHNKRGAFSSVYTAVWLEGPRGILDEEADTIARSGPIKVVLKRLDNSMNISKEYMKQVNIFLKNFKILKKNFSLDFFFD
jgi:hypothetical protein